MKEILLYKKILLFLLCLALVVIGFINPWASITIGLFCWIVFHDDNRPKANMP